MSNIIRLEEWKQEYLCMPVDSRDDCSRCNGKGLIKILDRRLPCEISCPTCRGTGRYHRKTEY